MQTDRRVSRIAVATLLISTVLLGGGMFTGSAVAQSNSTVAQGNSTVAQGSCEMSDPNQMDDCDPPDSVVDLFFADSMDRMYNFAKAMVQYSGFVVTFAGVTLWFATGENSDRAQTGMWLTFAGLALVAFYFGADSFISLTKWIATNGGG